MRKKILSKAYQEVFVDEPKYSGQVENHLSGLAAAIEDSDKDWRPTVSDLVRLLSNLKESNAIVAAGLAYGSAKAIGDYYPGPAILLYGAALDAIGSEPNTELTENIAKAKAKLRENGLDKDQYIRKLITAASNLAKLDKVSQKLRDEFTQGLRDSGFYNDKLIQEKVPEIVNITHDVRHKGLIERKIWRKENEVEGTSTNASYITQIDEIIFTDDKLRDLLPFAQTGCAFSILRRIKPRK